MNEGVVYLINIDNRILIFSKMFIECLIPGHWRN